MTRVINWQHKFLQLFYFTFAARDVSYTSSVDPGGAFSRLVTWKRMCWSSLECLFNMLALLRPQVRKYHGFRTRDLILTGPRPLTTGPLWSDICLNRQKGKLGGTSQQSLLSVCLPSESVFSRWFLPTSAMTSGFRKNKTEAEIQCFYLRFPFFVNEWRGSG